MNSRVRANGEGSIYPYRDGWAAYVWVRKPDGTRGRKYIYGRDREKLHARWIKLQQRASDGVVPTSVPTVGEYLAYWLREVVEPNLARKTGATYRLVVRLYIVPWLGTKRLDRLTARDVRTWLNALGRACQCCMQGKDQARPEAQRRCCAIGKCCGRTVSTRTVHDARTVLRSALSNAVTEDELLPRNVAMNLKVRKTRKRKPKAWSADEAQQFLVSAREDNDPLYAAFVLVLVLGLRRGEVLGLTWPSIHLDVAELDISENLQRVDGHLVHGDTKTEASDAPLPLPDICVSALKVHQERQEQLKAEAGPMWVGDIPFVFTTRDGMPIDPDNFLRSFKRRCDKAEVEPLSVHGARHTCGSLLAALDVHPRVAMEILRHSKIEVTMEVYTHVPDELTRAALKKLSDSLEGLS